MSDSNTETEKPQTLYRRLERYFPLVSFFAGFLYDALTLKRIDALTDSLVMIGYLIVSGVALLIIGLKEYGRLNSRFLNRRLEWIFILLHFCLGGLLSAYVIYYFKSASVSKSYIFVGLLAGLFILNELSPHRVARLKILNLLHFFCSFAFFTFFFPVITGWLNWMVFALGGIASLSATTLFWWLALKKELFDFQTFGRDLLVPPGMLFILMALLYAFNWIPPVPLSLKEIGVYRSVRRLPDGRYEVRYRQPRWYEMTKTDDRVFEFTEGEAIYCFSAVFAPTKMTQRIVHHWQMKDKNGNWISKDRISYPIVGGRDGGWRGFTRKSAVQPGIWRIDVETENNRVIGRINLQIVKAEKKPDTIKTDYQ